MLVRYCDDEMLKEAVWSKDGQKISILVELIVCQKNVVNALNSAEPEGEPPVHPGRGGGSRCSGASCYV